MKYNKINIAHKILIFSIIAALTFSLCGCSNKSTSLTLQDLSDANTIDSVIKSHDTIYEEFEYYENLDDEVTFKTINCYTLSGKSSDDENNDSADATSPAAAKDTSDYLYVVEGYDALDEASQDNFKYCIKNNIEYYMNYKEDFTIYPLTQKYLDYFDASSFTVYYEDYEKVQTVVKDGSDIVLTSVADLTDAFTEETLSHMEALCNNTLSKVKTVYTANKDTKLISSVQTFYVADDNTEYLFSKETVSYDVENKKIPSTDFADDYINSKSNRTVTIVEKDGTDTNINTYNVPKTLTIDFQCFENYHGYTIFNDENAATPFIEEKTDDDGNFEDATYYAVLVSTDDENVPVEDDNMPADDSSDMSSADAE